MLLSKICKVLEWKEDETDAKYLKARNTLDTIWNGLVGLADTNKDKKITEDEWLKMWGDCLNGLVQGAFPSWQKDYMELMFDVNDKSGDNHIDADEYKTFFSKFGVSIEDCDHSFAIISGGSNITRENFATLWRDYLTSNDSSAPCNYLFGPLK